MKISSSWHLGWGVDLENFQASIFHFIVSLALNIEFWVGFNFPASAKSIFVGRWCNAWRPNPDCINFVEYMGTSNNSKCHCPHCATGIVMISLLLACWSRKDNCQTVLAIQKPRYLRLVEIRYCRNRYYHFFLPNDIKSISDVARLSLFRRWFFWPRNQDLATYKTWRASICWSRCFIVQHKYFDCASMSTLGG